mgnify:CR=1 FL=1
MTIEYTLASFNIRTLQNVFLTFTCAPGEYTDKALHECYQVSDVDGSWDEDLGCRIEGTKEDGQYSLYSILKIVEVEDEDE